MMYREFRIPHDVEMETALGTTPVPGDEVGTRSVVLHSEDGAVVELTVDSPARSASLVVTRENHECVRLTREGATELRVSSESPEILIDFRTDDTTGRLQVFLRPLLRIEEATLFA
jgi:hypothetical protein